ncbi:MAG: 8-oxo-dGTP diphosphatase [Lachnospiraceae bacterium]|nr:8-oxo-dGTP diphosphatase [Lachnospiraceae bacterium]
MPDQKHLTTLCYIEKDGCYLMMHRTSKENDYNAGKWIGVGGHFKDAESPEECLLREVKEETGLMLTSYRFRGIVTFVSDVWGFEYMHLYTADAYDGELSEARMQDCPEGRLAWIPKEDVMDLPLWEGDKVFLPMLLEEGPPISLKLTYHGDELVGCKFF